MKLRFLLALSAALVTLHFAAEPVEAQRGKPLTKDPKVLKARYQRKAKMPFMRQIDWVLKMTDAQKLSQTNEVPIVAYFTRSFST